MRYVLGLDQGGSKTHGIVADENGRILGMGKSYGACHSSTGLDYAVNAVLEAADSALEQSGLTRDDIHTVVGGLTGIDWKSESEMLTKAIAPHFPASDVVIVNDCLIAMRAGTHKKNCAVLCAGSGLNCAVQKDKECFVYGFYIPDEYQGGYCLGRKTIQAVFDSYLGLIAETVLTDMVMDYFSETSVDELLYRHVTGKITDKQYLYLPILLEEAAKQGDNVAAQIWEDYGSAIVAFLTARMRKMELLNLETDIVLSGSIFKCKYRGFIERVQKEIRSKIPGAAIIEARYEPVVGAMLMGIERINGEGLAKAYENLELLSDRFPILRMQ